LFIGGDKSRGLVVVLVQADSVEWNHWPSQQWVPTITITVKRNKEVENNNNSSGGGGGGGGGGESSLSLIRASDGTNQN